MKYIKAEMHCHTTASDGSMQPETLIRRACERGYGAIASTDHNTTAAHARLRTEAAARGITLIGGIEWTTFHGHLTVLGDTRVNWRDVMPQTIDECLRRADEDGAVVTAAHPFRMGNPLCTGCYFEYRPTTWEHIRGYEIYSGILPHKSVYSARAKARWIELICSGYRISAMYGYDWHHSDEHAPAYGATYLLVDDRASEASCVRAVREGRTFVSVGICADICFRADGVRRELGDTLDRDAVGVVEITARPDPIFARRRAVELHAARIAAFDGTIEEYPFAGGKIEIPYTARSAFRIEIVGSADGESGELLITSPIYIKEKDV